MAISWSTLLRYATFWLLLRLGSSQVAIDMVTDSGQVAQCVININLAILSLNECGIAIAEGVHSCAKYDKVNVEMKVEASLGLIRDVASSVPAPKAAGRVKGEPEAESGGARLAAQRKGPRTSSRLRQAQDKVNEAMERYHHKTMERYHNATKVGSEPYHMKHTCSSNMINIFSSMTNAAAFLASAFDGCTLSTNRAANCAGQSVSIANALLGIASPSANMVNSCVKLRERSPLQSQEEQSASAAATAEHSRNMIRGGYWCAVNVNIAASYLANAALGILASKDSCTGANVSALVCSAQIEAVFSSFAFVANYVSAAVTVCGNLEQTVDAQCAADLSAIVASVLELCNAAQMINRDDSCGGLQRGLPMHDPVSWTKEWHEKRTGESSVDLAARPPRKGSGPNASVLGRRLSVEAARTELAKPTRAVVEQGMAGVAHMGELLI